MSLQAMESFGFNKERSEVQKHLKMAEDISVSVWSKY